MKKTLSQIFQGWATAVGSALLVNILLFYILDYAGFWDPKVLIDGKEPLTLFPVVFSTMLTMSVGTLIFLALNRYATKNSKMIFSWICFLFFVITLTNPFFFILGISTKMAIGLDLLHIAPAFGCWYFLTKD